MQDGLFPDIKHKVYHAMGDIVSNSYLGRLDKCPANAKIPMPDTPTLIFGRAFHSIVLDGLESFHKNFAVLPDTDRRTKEGKAAYALFCEESGDKDIISVADYEILAEMFSAIAVHPIASKLMLEGRSEMSVFWTDLETGLPCKFRPDRIPDGEHGVILDLKSVRDADVHAFTRAVVNYGYAREAAFYIDGFNAVSSAKVDAFIFICVEKEKPYRTEVYVLDELFVEDGRREYRRLMQVEAECRKNQFWPNFQYSEIMPIFMPGWMGGKL
jgi:exodeoxyribonuclease VIII